MCIYWSILWVRKLRMLVHRIHPNYINNIHQNSSSVLSVVKTDASRSTTPGCPHRENHQHPGWRNVLSLKDIDIPKLPVKGDWPSWRRGQKKKKNDQRSISRTTYRWRSIKIWIFFFTASCLWSFLSNWCIQNLNQVQTTLPTPCPPPLPPPLNPSWTLTMRFLFAFVSLQPNPGKFTSAYCLSHIWWCQRGSGVGRVTNLPSCLSVGSDSDDMVFEEFKRAYLKGVVYGDDDESPTEA